MNSSSHTILIATGNRHKAEEIAAILRSQISDLKFDFSTAADFPDVKEPEEPGETFLENAIIKAHYYARATGMLALADDSGLVVDALEGRPGVRSARYAATPEGRIERVLNEMKDVPPVRRTARFICVAALAHPDGRVETTEGRIEGWIAPTPRGSGGFGYDPIFIPSTADDNAPPSDLSDSRTLAQFSSEDKNAISHRGQAIHLLIPNIRAAVT